MLVVHEQFAGDGVTVIIIISQCVLIRAAR